MFSKAFAAQQFVEKRRRRNAKFMQKRLYNHNVITKADKGVAIVTVDVDDYVQEANQQWDNKDFYKKLTIDTTKINRVKVNRTINVLKSSHLLDEKIANYFLYEHKRIKRFSNLQ